MSNPAAPATTPPYGDIDRIGATGAAAAKPPSAVQFGPDAHRELITDFFSQNSAEYEIRIQLCTNPEAMAIEDATVHWSELESPAQGVATITFSEQHSEGVYRRAFGDDVLSFNSWRGLAAHRPLGSINRLKKRVFDASSDYWHTVNVSRKEPTSIDELPAQ
jgi:hypothetical protein